MKTGLTLMVIIVEMGGEYQKIRTSGRVKRKAAEQFESDSVDKLNP